MKTIKFIFMLLAVLLVIIIIKAIIIGFMVFGWIVKLLAISAIIAWILYKSLKTTKKSE